MKKLKFSPFLQPKVLLAVNFHFSPPKTVLPSGSLPEISSSLRLFLFLWFFVPLPPAAKKHLNQRIQNLDGKMETQKEILKSIQTTEVKTYYNGCLGAICGCGLVKAFQKTYYNDYGGGANELQSGFNKGTGLGAEIIGTFVLVYTVFSTTDPKRNARDSHVPVLAPLPVEFAVFMVHLATIPVNETGINLARSFGAAVIYTKVEVDQNTHHAKLVNIPGSYTKSVE